MDVLSLDTTDSTIPKIFSIEEFTPSQAHQALQERVSDPAGPTPLVRLKISHHQAAKLVAAGVKRHDVARRTGYSINTIHALMTNPAFKELVQHYSGEYHESMEEITEQMQAVTRDLLVEIQERLDAPGMREEVSLNELRALLTDLLDRSGHGPIKRVERTTQIEKRSIGIIQHVRTVAAERRYRPGEGTGEPISTLPSSVSERGGCDLGTVPIKATVSAPPTPIAITEEGSGL